MHAEPDLIPCDPPLLCRVLVLEGAKDLAGAQTLLEVLREHGVPLLQVCVSVSVSVSGRVLCNRVTTAARHLAVH